MQENLPVERLVRKALRAEEPIGRPGIRQLGIPQGAKRLEERLGHTFQTALARFEIVVHPFVLQFLSASHCLIVNILLHRVIVWVLTLCA